MATAKEKFVLQWELNAVIDACQKAAVALKLKLGASDRHHLVAKEQSLLENKIALPSSVEVKFIGMSEGTGIEIISSNLGFGSGASDKARSDLENFRARIHFELERPMREARQAEEHRVKVELDAAKRQLDEEREAQEREMRTRVIREREEKRMHDKAEKEARQAAQTASAAQSFSDSSRDVAVPTGSRAFGYAQTPDNPTGVGSDASGDIVKSLEKLLKLHQMGALSDDEFREAKRRLLNL